MKDKLLIVTKIKKTIKYLECIVSNFSKTEYVLKNNIVETSYQMLKLAYKSNIHKDISYMKDLVVEIRMLDYYTKISLDKKIISYKKYEVLGNHLLELNKMINAWIISEKSK